MNTTTRGRQPGSTVDRPNARDPGHASRPAPVEIDLHVHSVASACGYLSPEELVAITRAAGRQVLAVSDHDTAAGGLAVRDLVARTGDDILVLVGMELSTSDAGHVLVYGDGVEGDWGWRRGSPMPRHLPDGWVAIKAHPFRDVVKVAPPGPIPDRLPDLPGSIDAVEQWNGNDLLVKAPHRRADLDVASRNYVARQGKVAIAASDAHRASSLHAYHAVFARPVASVADAVDQVRGGEVRPGSLPEPELEARRGAWRRRRVVGWYVEGRDWRADARDAQLDECEAEEVVACFKGVRRLARSGATVADVVRDAGLDAIAAIDFLAIVREEALQPPRVR